MARSRTIPRCFGDRGLATTCRPSSTALDHDQLADIARALSHPARLAIIERLNDRRPKMTKELVAPSGLAPSTMSEHLRILRDADLVVTRSDGSGIWYCLCGDRLADFAASVGSLPFSNERSAVDCDQRP